MRLQIPRLIQDRLYLFRSNDRDAVNDVLLARPTSYTTIDDDGPFFDGPVTPRVAIIDLDAKDGSLRPGSKFSAATGRVDGRYELDEALVDPDVDPLTLEDTYFVQQSVFATVYHTLQFFEELLGHPVEWAFGRPQLLVVPRAGEMKNAFYERESGSLQFFEYGTVSRSEHTPARNGSILTALSHDIVVHETTHAILDGLAPDLYDAISPESLALHESIADLVAIFLTLLDDVIVWSILNITSTALDTFEVLGRVAEEFGHDVRLGENVDFLRSADNRYGLPGTERGSDVEAVNYYSPHDCSQVLTGAVFQAFRRHAESLSGDTAKKIRRAARDTCRLIFPALDLLPPGEAGFADFGRCVVAQASISGRGAKLARWLCEELQSRGINVQYTENEAPSGLHIIGRIDQRTVKRLAEDSRDELGLPLNADIDVTVVTRTRNAGGKKQEKEEVIARVAWSENETHALDEGLTGYWTVRTGRTLVFNGETGDLVAVIRPAELESTKAGRNGQLRTWMSRELLIRPEEPHGDAGIPVRRIDGRFQITASARSLHIVD